MCCVKCVNCWLTSTNAGTHNCELSLAYGRAWFIMTIVYGRSRIVCHASVESYTASWSIQGNDSFKRSFFFWFSHEFSNVSTYSKRYGLWQSSVPCVTSLMLAIHENKQAQGFPEHQVVCSFSWGVETINDSFTDEANPKHRILGNAYQMPATLILTSFHLGTRAWTPTPASPGHLFFLTSSCSSAMTHNSWGLSRLWVCQYHVGASSLVVVTASFGQR